MRPCPTARSARSASRAPSSRWATTTAARKTAESFLQNPLNHAYDERIYKTGDLGHFAPDGNLMFHGRKDRQVKHLGHRVELGEIDLAAAKVSGVEEACALYDQAHEQIWLFYTGAGVTKRDIAVALRADLPGFMVPRKIEQLDGHAPARQRQDETCARWPGASPLRPSTDNRLHYSHFRRYIYYGTGTDGHSDRSAPGRGF